MTLLSILAITKALVSLLNSIHYQHVDETASTQNLGKQLSNELSPSHLTFLTTSYQTEGRGTKKKKWLSPKNKDLLGTFIFFHEKTEDLENMAQLLTLATCHLLESLGFTPSIKWPNDIQISGKKIAGVLVEIQKPWIFAGIGLNVLSTFEDLKPVGQPATSLAIENPDKVPGIQQLRKGLAETFFAFLTLFLREGFTPFEEMFSRRLLSQKKT